MNHTGKQPWDEIFDKIEEEYKEFFPKLRLYSFKEVVTILRWTKEREWT